MRKNIVLFSIILFIVTSCGVYNSIMNLSKLKFKLGNVENFRVGSISIDNKSQLKDFGAMDVLKLTSQVVSGEFPVAFTVNVLAQNPNKKTNSTGSSLSEISLDSFPWTLYINGKQTISGNISSPVKVPAVEDATIIPLELKLDMLDFFKGEGLNNLIDLALSLGGKEGSSAKLKIVAEPVLGTPLGKLNYPSPITIIDKSFN